MTEFLNTVFDQIQASAFYEFAVLLTLCAFFGLIGTILRQPLIIIYIAIGIIVGPSALGIVSEGGEITLLAKLGIAILLFIVGLKLDLNLIRSLGVVSVVIGSIQMFLTVALGTLISMGLGFEQQDAFMIGVALAFSSTIIIIKLLSDKREIDSAHGRIALGVLIIQDLAVVFSMIVLAAIGMGTDQPDTGITDSLLRIAGSTAILMVVLGIFMRFIVQPLTAYVARNNELLLCFAIAWAVMLAALCDAMGLSKELGGLLAGVTLASTPFRETIMSRLASLRDFLLLFFFIALGIQIDLGSLGGVIMPAIVLSVFVMLFKPLIVLTCAGFLGYGKRTGFLAGLSLAQISEFSLIFASMAFTLGLIDQSVLGLITLVALITIIASTYLLSLSQQIYGFVEPALGVFERAGRHKEQEDDTTKKKKSYDVIILGLGRYGQAMARSFIEKKKSVLAVDFDPEVIKESKNKRYDAVYGDAADPEFYEMLPFKNAEWFVSALPQHKYGVLDQDPRLVILETLKQKNFKGKIALSCHHHESVQRFKKLGADLVFLPFHDAAERAVNMVEEAEEASA